MVRERGRRGRERRGEEERGEEGEREKRGEEKRIIPFFLSHCTVHCAYHSLWENSLLLGYRYIIAH